MGINTLTVAHQVIQSHVKPGDFCVDATAGRGKDTAFLCGLTGNSGKVMAFDIQQEAVDSTKELLWQKGLEAQVILDSHSHMERYIPPESVDCMVFNFGYLPGGDHKLYTKAETSIPAIEQGMRLLKPGGLMSLCIYYGGDSGYEERDALLAYLPTIDPTSFTVLQCAFVNRGGDPPMPVFLWKMG